MSDESKTRKGIALAAKDLVRASNGRMSYEQARTRVAKAKRRGEMIRKNKNK
tara:strand:- start:4460 stop:4615 length:156 start_codon:yes stop_codon:yes gene_type:complete